MAQKKAHCHCFGKDQASPLVSKLQMAAYMLAGGEAVYFLWLSPWFPLDGAMMPCVHSVSQFEHQSKQSPSLTQGMELKSLFKSCFLPASLLSADQACS